MDCREMEFRLCPSVFLEGCGQICARFESDDPTVWLYEMSGELKMPEDFYPTIEEYLSEKAEETEESEETE